MFQYAVSEFCNFVLIAFADSGFKSIHALQWLCKKSWETHLQDGWYEISLALYGL